MKRKYGSLSFMLSHDWKDRSVLVFEKDASVGDPRLMSSLEDKVTVTIAEYPEQLDASLEDVAARHQYILETMFEDYEKNVLPSVYGETQSFGEIHFFAFSYRDESEKKACQIQALIRSAHGQLFSAVATGRPASRLSWESDFLVLVKSVQSSSHEG